MCCSKATGQEALLREDQKPAKGGDARVDTQFQPGVEHRGQESALGEGEECFRTIVNTMPQLAWVARPDDGRIFWYNQRWYDYTGTTPEHMEALGWQSVLDSEVLPRVQERLKASLITGEPFEMVVPIRGADQRFRQFLSRAHPLKDAEGNVLQWFGTNTDITEHGQVKTALRESEDRFRSVLENARDCIYRLNLQTGCYEYMSPAAESVLGFPLGELLAQHVDTRFALVHPEDLPAVRASLSHLEESGEGNMEYRQRTKSGDYRWFSTHMSLTRDCAGQPLYRGGNVRDITDRKRKEEALQDAQAKLEAYAENLEKTVALRTAELQKRTVELQAANVDMS